MTGWQIALVVVVAVYLLWRRWLRAAGAAAVNVSAEADGWLKSIGLNPGEVMFNLYQGGTLARNQGAVVMVGIGRRGNLETVGFVAEIVAGHGVIDGAILEPFGVATQDKEIVRDLRLMGSPMPLLDALLARARNLREGAGRSSSL